MSNLHDRLKAKRDAQLPPQPHVQIITPQERLHRERMASIDKRHEYEMCAICSENLAPRRYFISPRKHFPICGDCITLAKAHPPHGMHLKEAIHYLKTIKALN